MYMETVNNQFSTINLWFDSQGMDSGFGGGEDESYNVYDKPWRQDKDIGNSLYRPSKNVDKDNYGDDLDKIMKSGRYVAYKTIIVKL